MVEGEIYTDGFDEFSKMLEEFKKRTEVKNVTKVLEIGARQLVEDVRGLPRPRSEINTPGYTHLLDTMTYKAAGEEVEAGWGKYYGPMVENGTVRMKGTEHLRLTFKRNKEKYYKNMQKAIFG